MIAEPLFDSFLLFYFFHRKSDAAAVGIDTDDFGVDDVAGVDDVRGMTEGMVAELGAVDQPRRLDTEVDEGAEIDDVLDRAADDGPYFEIGEGHDVLSGKGFRELAADVAAGLTEFFQNILDGRLAGAEGGCQFRGGVALNLIAQAGHFFRFLQIVTSQAVLAGNLSGQVIRFGMDRRIVEGLFAVFDAQEAGALGKGSRSQAGNV